jgi:hypothetical protein
VAAAAGAASGRNEREELGVVIWLREPAIEWVRIRQHAALSTAGRGGLRLLFGISA